MKTQRMIPAIHGMACTLVLSLSALDAPAQNLAGPPPPNDRPPREGSSPQDPRPNEDQALTPEQTAKVKSILAKYKESLLTAADARAINNAFREAGMRNGSALQQAIRGAGFAPERIGALAPPAGQMDKQEAAGNPPEPEQPDRSKGGADRPGPGQGNYSLEQAISDRAQLSMIAFDGLAFLTGSMGGNTFLPPGKVADFCGFQYMRDVDTNQLGHNTSFVPRAANSVLAILDEGQKAQLVALAKEQEKPLTEFAYKRFPLVKAFCRQLAGDLPTGSTGLSRQAVMAYTAEVFAIDGLLSYRRAEVLGGIVRSLTISTSLTGDSGEAFLAALTGEQRKLVTGLVERQRPDLAEIVKTRRAIATELRRFMKESSVDKNKVMVLAKHYGELDGEISHSYATAFAQVGKTLTTEQKGVLLKLRNLDAKYDCKGIYVFSQPIAMPEIRNTDFLFEGVKR